MSIDTGGARSLTHWEQIDNGKPFTEARKFLTAAPIIMYVFFLSIYMIFIHIYVFQIFTCMFVHKKRSRPLYSQFLVFDCCIDTKTSTISWSSTLWH